MLLVHLINRVVREKERLIGRRDEGIEVGGEEESGDGGGGRGGLYAAHSCGCFEFSPSLRTKESPEPHQR